MNLAKSVINSLPLAPALIAYVRVLQLRLKGVVVTGFPRAYSSKIEATASLAEQSHVEGSSIGSHTSIGRWTNVLDAEVGRYCSISWNVTIGAKSHPSENVSTSAFFFAPKYGLVDKDLRKTTRTIVGSDCWLGAGSVIMPGVTIGVGAIIGSNAVVTKDIPPYAVAVGVPAKVIRYRFDKDIIEQLLESRWWNLPEDKLIELKHLFTSKVDLEAAMKLKEFCQSSR